MLEDPAVSQMLGDCNLFDMIVNSPEEFLDGCPTDDADKKILGYVRKKMSETQAPADNFTSEVAGPLIGVMTLLMRSWGLVETFLVDRPQRAPEKWVRLSALGRRAFNEALGQFLDRDVTAAPEADRGAAS